MSPNKHLLAFMASHLQRNTKDRDVCIEETNALGTKNESLKQVNSYETKINRAYKICYKIEVSFICRKYFKATNRVS